MHPHHSVEVRTQLSWTEFVAYSLLSNFDRSRRAHDATAMELIGGSANGKTCIMQLCKRTSSCMCGRENNVCSKSDIKLSSWARPWCWQLSACEYASLLLSASQG